uniref:Uncharacterized protein n=1 Tax=Tanacetum cinerariifolium TaxID=118510 RepID=A0A699HLD6_TANCI|nr:hypothetical protein [Tanacetum cinerariifolium]
MSKDEREWKGKVLTIGILAYECQDMRMRRISLRNSLVGNGYMVNILVKMTRWMTRDCSDIGLGEFTLSSLDVLQGFSFFLQMGLTLILATLDGLDVGLLGDVIGEDDG